MEFNLKKHIFIEKYQRYSLITIILFTLFFQKINFSNQANLSLIATISASNFNNFEHEEVFTNYVLNDHSIYFSEEVESENSYHTTSTLSNFKRTIYYFLDNSFLFHPIWKYKLIRKVPTYILYHQAKFFL